MFPLAKIVNRLQDVNYFCKKLYLRCLREFLIRHWLLGNWFWSLCLHEISRADIVKNILQVVFCYRVNCRQYQFYVIWKLSTLLFQYRICFFSIVLTFFILVVNTHPMPINTERRKQELLVLIIVTIINSIVKLQESNWFHRFNY